MPPNPIRLAVLLSGGGTTLQNLIDRIKQGDRRSPSDFRIELSALKCCEVRKLTLRPHSTLSLLHTVSFTARYGGAAGTQSHLPLGRENEPMLKRNVH
jgi:hypothetical protein